MSEDIAYREKRYLIMMGIRLVCFVIAVVIFVNGGGWLTAIPAVGAIAIPYFAVVFANGGREPSGRARFRPYEWLGPKTLGRFTDYAGQSTTQLKCTATPRRLKRPLSPLTMRYTGLWGLWGYWTRWRRDPQGCPTS